MTWSGLSARDSFSALSLKRFKSVLQLHHSKTLRFCIFESSFGEFLVLWSNSRIQIITKPFLEQALILYCKRGLNVCSSSNGGGMYLHFHVTLAWLIDWVLVVASKDWLASNHHWCSWSSSLTTARLKSMFCILYWPHQLLWRFYFHEKLQVRLFGSGLY